ncbi:Citrate/oxoglutarate carrier protein [Porphyridium purpureum]|uniref:Citrate/oxoglutarate carrier protein n=1 Tax=Porphyridium purpureum TaxID=35688 RepID=A0A5J4YV10_PORPP|nr:Citrate/oxoglutarate carrier protein [Porphyridium purpureum]|eukprot:POR3374..scf227_4
MAPPAGKGLKDIRNGAVLQCVEAATLGLPFEVWKTRMGRMRGETTLQAFRNIYVENGRGLAGVSAFWKGMGPKMVESASKGAVLLFSKELINTELLRLGTSQGVAGLAAGAGGGVCQTVVMGPCTYVVTALVTGDKSKSMSQVISSTWRERGLKGFYPGGSAIAFRQATNWASRQGFTDSIRVQMKRRLHGDEKAKLTGPQEIVSGVLGGILSAWNHPFEVARIEMQARANAGEAKMSMLQVFSMVSKEHGVAGLFKGVVPRIGLGVWQTLFMVNGAHYIRERLG